METKIYAELKYIEKKPLVGINGDKDPSTKWKVLKVLKYARQQQVKINSVRTNLKYNNI